MSRFEPVTNKAEKTDNCSVNVCYLGDKLYALTETPHLREISRETLDVIGEKVQKSNVQMLYKMLYLTHFPFSVEYKRLRCS